MKSPLALAFLSLFLSLPALAIVNGEVARPGSTIDRHTVLLRLGKGLCSGTILTPDIVITAAHCLENPREPITVSFGINGERGLRRGIGARRHQRYDGFANDVAIVRFAGGLPAGSAPAPALDGNPGEIPSGSTIISAGYGDTEARAGQVGTLRHAKFEVMGTHGAQVVLRGRGVSTCFGDSGGPAYLEHQGELILFGVVNGSLGGGSACGGALTFSRLDSHADWITRTIKELRR